MNPKFLDDLRKWYNQYDCDGCPLITFCEEGEQSLCAMIWDAEIVWEEWREKGGVYNTTKGDSRD